MELRQLEYFLAVVDQGQFTRAARQCHVAQSALSTSIRNLETELGVSLFTRTTRRVDLTDAGRTLVTDARRALGAIEDARTALVDVGAVLRGTLVVGGISTPGTLNKAKLLAAFGELHPAVEVRYVHGTTRRLLDDLQRGIVDLAFVSLYSEPPAGVEIVPLVAEELYFVCRSDHALADAPEVGAAELADEPVVGASISSVNHVLDHLFPNGGARGRSAFDVDDLSTAFELVRAGLGVTFLPDSIAHGSPDLRAVPIVGRPVAWTVAAATPEGHRTTARARAFRDLAVQAAGARPLDVARSADRTPDLEKGGGSPIGVPT